MTKQKSMVGQFFHFCFMAMVQNEIFEPPYNIQDYPQTTLLAELQEKLLYAKQKYCWERIDLTEFDRLQQLITTFPQHEKIRNLYDKNIENYFYENSDANIRLDEEEKAILLVYTQISSANFKNDDKVEVVLEKIEPQEEQAEIVENIEL